MKIYRFLLIMLLAIPLVLNSCEKETEETPEPVEDPTNLILDVEFEGVSLASDPEINHEDGKIFVYTNTIISKLTPIFTLSEGAIVNPKGGKEYDFSEPKEFNVISTKGDGERKYLITVDLHKKSLNYFKLKTGEKAYEFAYADGIITEIEEGKYRVDVKINANVDITSLIPYVEKNSSVTLEPAEAVAYDFSNPKSFTLKDGEEVLAEYEVHVEKINKIDRVWNAQTLSPSHDGVEFLKCDTDFKLDCSKGGLSYFNDFIPFKAYAVKVDMSLGYEYETFLNSTLKTVSKTVADYNASSAREAIIGVNGGYFSGDGTSYSLLVKDSEILEENIPTLSRESKTYFVTRGAFGEDTEGNFIANWVFNVTADNVYSYSIPSPNIAGEKPQVRPSESFPEAGVANNYVNAVGGGPILVKNSTIAENFDYELFQTDVSRSIADRTAVGVDAEGNLIIVVVEGRSGVARGSSLEDLADIMLNDFSCIDAINFDGGGSTTLVINGELVHKTSGGSSSERPLSTGILITK